MIKKIFTISTILLSLSAFSQDDYSEGYIITESNDTIHGELKNKNYFKAKSVKLIRENKSIKYNKKSISGILLDSTYFVKSEYNIWSKRFFTKESTGFVSIYSRRNNLYLGVYDSDLHFGRINSGLKIFCDDYPNFDDSTSSINSSNLYDFIEQYNYWKSNNSDSKSYYESNMHKKKRINIKLSLLLPGIGIELGLSDKFTINSFLKYELGMNGYEGFYVNPVFISHLRYYYNNNNRVKSNIRTYKYSGNYLSLIHGYYPNYNVNLAGVEYGWQRTIGKYWYSNIGLGLGKYIGYDLYALLLDFDFGFNF